MAMTNLRAFILVKIDAQVLVYEDLWSIKETMDNAVYTLFSLLLKDFVQP